MKIFSFLFLMAVFASSTCKKSKSGPRLTHCDNLVNETLSATDPSRIYMVTAFTPNGDGLNDGFHPIVKNVQSVSWKVHDENNNVVFSSANSSDRFSPSAFDRTKKFYYRIEAISAENKKIGICGEVTAIKCLPQGTLLRQYTFEDQYTGNDFSLPTAETVTECK